MFKRDRAITFYLSKEEKQDIMEKAKESGLAISDYIRLMLKRGKLL